LSDKAAEDDNINTALDRLEEKEETMTEKELELRDSVNKELSKQGFHVRIALLKITKNELYFDFVEPVDQWFSELPAANEFAWQWLHQWQLSNFPD
jgi:hypothetical protein